MGRVGTNRKGERTMLETVAIKAVEQNEEMLVGLAKKIWEHPETAYNEV